MKRAIGTFVMLFTAAMAQAQYSGETRVVIGVDNNGLLTANFRKTFRDTFAAGLRGAAEGVAKVTVVDVAELRPEDRLPAWETALAQGLEKLDRAAIGDSAKTQYVSIKVVNGQFVIRSRMTDGSIGWISPTVQEDRTPDREALPRLALAQVLRDFGLTGRIDSSDGDRMAMVRLYSSNAMDARLAAWVKPGDLFALVQLGGAGRSARVPNVLLRAMREPADGKVECRVESRFVKPLDGWETGKYRVVKLPAVRGPLRLNLVGMQGVAVDSLIVRLSANGFDRNDAIKETGVSRDGRFTSAENYDRIAYARILAGDRLLAQAPVEILRDAAVTVEIRSDGVVEVTDVAQRLIRGRIQDLLARVGEDNAEVRKELDAGKNPQALQRVNQMLARIDDELPNLESDIAELRKRASAGLGMDEIERGLRDTRDAEKSLKVLQGRLKAALAAVNSPDEVKKREALQLLTARAEQAVDEADYDAAIATYEEALKQSGDWPEATKRLAELKQGWRIVSDKHRDARKQVYEVWAKSLSADDFAKNLESTRQAFAVCKSVGDRFTPRKIYLSLQRGANVLSKRSEELRSAESEDAKRQLEAMGQTKSGMAALLNDIEAYLRPAKQ